MPKPVPPLPRRIRLCGLDVKVERFAPGKDDLLCYYGTRKYARIRIAKDADPAHAHTLLLQGALQMACFLGNCGKNVDGAMERMAVMLRPVFGRWRPGCRIPESIVVNGVAYTVHRMPAEYVMRADGVHWDYLAAIYVAECENASHAEMVFAHELLHAGFSAIGFMDEPEESVCFLGGAIAGMLRDNPQWEIPK